MSDEARAWLASEGFDPAYGARPLRRLVQTEIGDRLARALLSGQVRDGDGVVVDRDEHGLTVGRAQEDLPDPVKVDGAGADAP